MRGLSSQWAGELDSHTHTQTKTKSWTARIEPRQPEKHLIHNYVLNKQNERYPIIVSETIIPKNVNDSIILWLESVEELYEMEEEQCCYP